MRLGGAEIRFTTVADGDFSDGAEPAAREAAQRRIVDRPWVTVHQVHGDAVVVADASTPAGLDADAVVTGDRSIALAVRTADCAPVALAGGGLVGVVHAGWRGLVAGVVEQAVTRMRDLGARDVVAALGPCVHASCYQFGEAELDEVAARFGDGVRSRTADGKPALDVPEAVRVAVAAATVRLVHDAKVCTACSRSHWSHRARGDTERQATVVWLP